MSAVRCAALAVAALLASSGAALAEGPAIDHSEIKCLVAGKYRKMPAKFSPADVAQPRVYFRPEGVPSWYYVEMKPEDPLGHVGVLPKPTKKLVGKHIDYYVEAASKDFDSGRTPEYAPIVVAKDGECDRDLLPPLYSKNPPAAVFPSLPQGFAMGGAAGLGTAAAVVAGGAAVAGGVIVATKDDDEPIPGVPSTTTPPTTQVPVPTTTTLAPGRLGLACQADVRQGVVPLTVKFNAQANGGTGAFDFLWNFGDGGTSTQVNPSHTFTVPGVYDVTVRATSGGIVDTCVRTVTVLPATSDLDVRVAGAGTVSGPGIACPGDCTETYASDRVVTLTATPSGTASVFLDWSGDCSGNSPTCQVSMDRARSVAARFQGVTGTTVPLTVSFGGTGTGTVTGLACTAPCTAAYPVGTTVTLNATATGGSTFSGWTGACTGPNPCAIVMTGPQTATPVFTAPAPTFQLSVSSGGAGSGTITGTGIACPADCTETYPAGTPVTLTASPNTGSGFGGWTGDCASVTGPVCSLTLSANRTAGANFVPTAPVSLFLTVVANSGSAGSVQVTPGGTVGGAPPPGNTTVFTVPVGTTLTLTPVATAGGFAGWTGDCAMAFGPSNCVLLMTVDRTATATFAVPLVTDAAAGASTVVSRLEAPRARLAATLNGAPLAPPPAGPSTWTVAPQPGDNRLEATAADGGAGMWRVELAGVRGLERGSVRVTAGDVVSIGPDAVVFRLKGRAGERVGLAFSVR